MDRYTFKLVEDKLGKKLCYDFVKTHHYTKMVGAGSKYCFGLYEGETLIGVGLWRTPNGRLTYRLFDKLGVSDNSPILDLTRLCLIDETRKNTESYFLSLMIKHIQQNNKSIRFLITYADFNQGHNGTIYRASNWMEFGVGGDTKKSYNVLEGGRLELTSSRWLKTRKCKTISIPINKKFRYFYPLNVKRNKILKLLKDDVILFKKQHKDLEEKYRNTQEFNLKDGSVKYWCETCKCIYTEYCNHDVNVNTPHYRTCV